MLPHIYRSGPCPSRVLPSMSLHTSPIVSKNVVSFLLPSRPALAFRAPRHRVNMSISNSMTLPREYGYVCLTVFASVLVHHFYMSFGVASARKKYGVKYPALYAGTENKDADAFNCVQRAHQNSLENYPQFLAVLLLGGWQFPITAAIAGTIYLLGRIVYFQGYSTGVPDKRLRGAFSYFALFTLYSLVVRTAMRLLTAA